ncbi:MAG: DUF4430 domain-containing protein [Bacillota bacterium]|nr:DUF4430 domain-containing protein [Bacillota bacterium]
MKWLKQRKKWLVIGLVLLAALAFAYWYGGGAPDSRGWGMAPEQPARQTEIPAAEESIAEITPETTPDEAEQTPDEAAEAEPAPAGGGTCTISISCATILDNMELCDPAKQELVPADGVILAATAVQFTAGESAFDLLLRVCQSNGIHMEYVNTPMYDAAYIEGIANLYEFDAGELSGWMYQVNGWFPNYGCSRYQLADGDVIKWVYTCDLGYDVGGGYAAGE